MFDICQPGLFELIYNFLQLKVSINTFSNLLKLHSALSYKKRMNFICKFRLGILNILCNLRL